MDLYAYVQNLSKNLEDINQSLKNLKTSLGTAEGTVKDGMERSAQMQYWDLVSGLVGNCLEVLILATLLYITYKKCAKEHKTNSIKSSALSSIAVQPDSVININSNHSRSLIFTPGLKVSNLVEEKKSGESLKLQLT